MIEGNNQKKSKTMRREGNSKKQKTNARQNYINFERQKQTKLKIEKGWKRKKGRMSRENKTTQKEKREKFVKILMAKQFLSVSVYLYEKKCVYEKEKE